MSLSEREGNAAHHPPLKCIHQPFELIAAMIRALLCALQYLSLSPVKASVMRQKELGSFQVIKGARVTAPKTI